MSPRFAAYPRLFRWFPIPVFALALGTPATAQILPKPPKGATNIAIQVPAASKGGLTSKTGMPWNQFKKNGLTMAVEGQGGMDVVVHVIRLKEGKVVNRWSSARVSARGGTMSLAGDKFLPGTALRPGTVTPPGGRAIGETEKNIGVTGDIAPANPWIPVATAERALATGDLSPFIQPGKMGMATGLIIVAVPSCKSGDGSCLNSRTQATLVMPCMFSDQ